MNAYRKIKTAAIILSAASIMLCACDSKKEAEKTTEKPIYHEIEEPEEVTKLANYKLYTYPAFTAEEVTDEAVEKRYLEYIDTYNENGAKYEPDMDRTDEAKEGDCINIEWYLFHAGKEVEGYHQTDYEWIVGEPIWILEDINDVFTGKKPGSKTVQTYTVNDDTINGLSAGDTFDLVVIFNHFMKKIDITQDNGYIIWNVDSKEEAYKIIRESLEEDLVTEDENRIQTVYDYGQYVLKNSTVSINANDQRIYDKFNAFLKYYEYKAEENDQSMYDYLQSVRTQTIDELKLALWDYCVEEVKMDIIFDKIAQNEQIELTDEQINSFIEKNMDTVYFTNLFATDIALHEKIFYDPPFPYSDAKSYSEYFRGIIGDEQYDRYIRTHCIEDMLFEKYAIMEKR